MKFMVLVFAIFPVTINFVNAQNSNLVFPKDESKDENSKCETSDGVDGICKKISDCPINRIARRDICSFEKNTAIYCCANELNFTVSNTTAIPSPLAGKLKAQRPAEASCEMTYPFVDPYCPECFIGGTRSLAEEHPHMAAIGWTDADGTIDWKCGGSAIAKYFIITAAHCTTSRGVSPDVVRTGDLNLLVEEKNIYPHDYNITDIFVHPDYVITGMYHDIALIKYAEHLTRLYPRPACLWFHQEIPEKELLGMGYGTTQYAGPRSNELFQGNLTTVSNEECSRKFPISTNLPQGIIPQQLCAQDPEHKKDTCQGDSGGPLQFYAGGGLDPKPMIAAITSFGEYCAGETPGVYTRISEYIDWIESIVWPQTQLKNTLLSLGNITTTVQDLLQQ